MRATIALAVLPAMMAVPGVASGPESALPAVLSILETGQWDLRSRDPGEPSMRVCVRDRQALLQLRHQGQACKRFVVEDSPRRTDVAYTCPRTGHGRTVLRAETPRLIQIDSQGVADGYPFALNLEGRRTGTCGAETAHK